MAAPTPDWYFRGLKQNTMMLFPILDKNRKETVEQTLSTTSTYFEAYQPRTTHLFKSDKDCLEKIRLKIAANPEFTAVQIIHSSSDLGLTHIIEAKHKDDWLITFDGLLIRATKTIFPDRFKTDALLGKTGVPHISDKAFNDFEGCINQVFPDKHVETIYSYYTIDETNWQAIGLRRQGEAQLRLVINDPNYVTITALIFTEMGKDFSVYLGDVKRINEMLAHDIFIGHEIALYTNFFREKYKEANNYRNTLKIDFGGAIAPVYNILKKHNSWNSVKRTMRAIYSTKDFIEKAKHLLSQLKKTEEKRWAFFNGPRQIWLMGEEQDYEEKIQHPTPHFYVFRLEESLEIKKLQDEPEKPAYTYDIQEFENILNATGSQIGELYERQRDLLTAFQTEFSLYAVWFAIGAIAIAVLSLLIPR